jgi:FKBP-type peptidyl-prolyl cis-trans isomerase FkpA
MANAKTVRVLLLAAACAGCAAGPTPMNPSEALEFGRAPSNSFEEAFAKEEGARPIRWGGWIKTLTPGTGDSPGVDDKVKVNYRGTLVDGTEFDSSFKRGEPAVFALSGVIPCWTNGMMMMRIGEKAKLVCPAASAYGDKGSPPSIPGGATLAFEIELLGVVRN